MSGIISWEQQITGFINSEFIPEVSRISPRCDLQKHKNVLNLYATESGYLKEEGGGGKTKKETRFAPNTTLHSPAAQHCTQNAGLSEKTHRSPRGAGNSGA